MSATRFGSFEELLESSAIEVRPIVARLRALVLSIHPEAVETVRLGDRAATYGVGPRKNIEGYCYILPHTKWVNLGFLQGASLPDPDGLLEGTGASMRHIKIRDVDAAEQPDVRHLIECALEERRNALNMS